MPSCDFSLTRNWLAAAGGAIVTSAGFVAGAAIANGSFFGAAASPALMVAAGVAAGGAKFALSEADDALKQYCSCLSTTGRSCGGQCGNLSRNIEAIEMVMGIEAFACFTTAAVAWVPWLGEAPILVILGSLIVEGILTASAIAFLISLLQCAQQDSGPITIRSAS